MVPKKNLLRIAVSTSLGFVLLAVVGCGNDSIKLDPEGGEKLKQARINAYGPAGYTKEKGGSGSAPAAESAQAAARRKAMGGH